MQTLFKFKFRFSKKKKQYFKYFLQELYIFKIQAFENYLLYQF